MDMHEMRKKIDKLIFEIEQRELGEFYPGQKRCVDLVKTKLQEAKMWCGKVLECENKPLPKEYRDYSDKREETISMEPKTTQEPIIIQKVN